MSRLRMSGDSRAGERRAATRARPAPVRAASAVEQVLRLQRLAGNQATSALLTQRATAPADVDVGFNVMDTTHKLLIAIDQKQVSISTMTRHVEFDAVVAVLRDLTAAEAKQVWDAYLAHEGRTLYNDLFGGGESGFPSDLPHDRLRRIAARRSGTRAAGGAPGGGRA